VTVVEIENSITLSGRNPESENSFHTDVPSDTIYLIEQVMTTPLSILIPTFCAHPHDASLCTRIEYEAEKLSSINNEMYQNQRMPEHNESEPLLTYRYLSGLSIS